MAMFTTITPIDMTGFIKTDDIIDDLVTSASDKVLSANQGKVLKELIDDKVTLVSMALVGNNIEATMSDDSVISFDVSALLLDKNAISGAYNEATQSIVITLNDATSFSIPVANLLPVLTDNTISGDGSGVPLSIIPSSDDTNILTIGNDGRLLVQATIPSTDVNNGLTVGTDGNLYIKMLDEDDMASDDDTAIATQQSIKKYISNEFLARDIYFIPYDSITSVSNDDVLAYCNTNNIVDSIVYYNGTSDAGNVPTYIWYIGNAGTIILLKEPFNAQLPIVQDLSTPSTTDVLSTQGISDILNESVVSSEIEHMYLVGNFTVADVSTSPIRVSYTPVTEETEHIKYDDSDYTSHILHEGIYKLSAIVQTYCSYVSDRIFYVGEIGTSTIFTSIETRADESLSMSLVSYIKVPEGETLSIGFSVGISSTGTKRQMEAENSYLLIERIGNG